MTNSSWFYSSLDLPDGLFQLFYSESGLTALHFPGEKKIFHTPALARALPEDSRIVLLLKRYFEGEKTDFGELSLDWSGYGEFCRKVWQAAREIPWGTTLSYGEVAALIGKPQASRAVGRALGMNPLPVIVPCHRVVGKTGDLTGFALGLPWKIKLLQLEGIKCIK